MGACLDGVLVGACGGVLPKAYFHLTPVGNRTLEGAGP